MPGRERLLWGLAIVTTFLASPHVLTYDLVVLIPAALLVLDVGADRRARLALAALALLTWTAIIRHGFLANLPYPLGALGGSWNALPLLALWSSYAVALGGLRWPTVARGGATRATAR